MPEASAAAGDYGVVIVSWNVRELLERCLLTCLAAPTPPSRVVVIDNASTDGSVEAVRGRFPDAEVIANAVNAGFARACNQGLAALGCLEPPPDPDSAPKAVILLNPDTEVVADALGDLARYLEAHPGVGVVGPRLIHPDGTPQPVRRRFPGVITALAESTPLAWHWPENPLARRYRMHAAPEVAGPVDWVTGAVLGLRSAAVRACGGLDEGYFMYSEELDLCRRMGSSGWATHYLPGATVIHHEGRSSDQVVPARHLRFHRSRVRYFQVHHGHRQAALVRAGTLLQYASELVLEGTKALFGHKRAMRLERMRLYWRVLRDGLAPSAAATP